MTPRIAIILTFLCLGSPLRSENVYDADLAVMRLDIQLKTDLSSNSVQTVAKLSIENVSNNNVDKAEFFVCPGMNDPNLRADIGRIRLVHGKTGQDLAYTVRKVEDPYVKGNEWSICEVDLGRPIAPGGKFGLEFEYVMRGLPDHSSAPVWRSAEGIKELFLRSDFQWCPTLYVPTTPGVIANLHQPKWTLRMEYPTGYVGVADGRLVSREKRRGVIRDTWRSLMDSYPHVFVSTYKIERRTADGYTLEFYAPDEEVLEKGAELFDRYARIFSAFVRAYGHPGHPVFRFIGSPVHESGNAVAMGLVVPMDSLTREEQTGFVAHEMAHTWWGWLAPTHGEGSKFLREAMAEYSAFWAARGIDRLIRSVSNIFDYDPRPRQAAPRRFLESVPLIHQEGSDPLRVIDANYQKGPLVVNQLRLELGEEVFFRGLRAFIHHFRNKAADIADFIGTFNAVTGKDQTPLFKELLWGTRYPICRLVGFKSERRGDRWLTRVTIRNEGECGWNCPLRLKTAGRDVETLFKLGGRDEKNFRFESPEEVREVVIDPDFVAYQYSPGQELRFWTTHVSRGGRHWAYFWKSYAAYASGQYAEAVDAINEHFASAMAAMGTGSIEELSRTRRYPDSMYFLFMRGLYNLALGESGRAEEDIKRAIPFLLSYLSKDSGTTGPYIIRSLYADGTLHENTAKGLGELLRGLTGEDWSWDEDLSETEKTRRLERWMRWWDQVGKYRKLNLKILERTSRP